MTTPTREQIEAAGRKIMWHRETNEWHERDGKICPLEGCIEYYCYELSELQSLKEQWQREAFLAATEGPCDDEGRFAPDYVTFEDWKAQNEGEN